MQVADALAHGASQGVLHRDIKPSNLLLDDTGNVWVTDFGLAKAASDSDDLTHTGDIIGTLRYIAPERFSGPGDLRSDVYSLGLTLYELLALRPAFDATDRNKLVNQVMHDEPVRPRKLNRSVPRDLETVVLKAIARDPADRYQTPAELAEDLKRYVEDRPVKARRVSEPEMFWRLCRRNPLPASLLALIVLVVLAGFVGVFWQWRQTEAARKHEKQARNAAARQAAGLLLDRGIEDARGGSPARALHLFVRALGALPADDPEAAPLERVIRANLSAWAETVPALEHIFPSGPRFGGLAYTRDGELIAVAVGPDEVQCFRTDTGRPVGPPVKVAVGHGAALAFAADGRSLWIASPGYEKVVDQWALHRMDPASGRTLQPPIPNTGPIVRLAVTPEGKYLVGVVLGLHPNDRGPGGDAEGSRIWRMACIMVWETATGRVVRNVDVNADTPESLTALSPNGKAVTVWFVRASHYEGLTFTLDGKEPATSLGRPPWSPPIHFQNNMRTALAIKDGQLHRWSATKPAVLGPGVPTPFRSMHEAPSADGRSVVCPTDGRVYDTGAGRPARPACASPTRDGSETAMRAWNRARTGGSRRPGFPFLRAPGDSGGSPIPTADPRFHPPN
jgi:hypothetical protein